MPACGAGQATLLNRKVGRRAGPSPTRSAPRGAPFTRRRLLFLSGLSLLKGFCAPRKVFRDALPARSRGFDRGAPDLFDQLRIREAGRRNGGASSSGLLPLAASEVGLRRLISRSTLNPPSGPSALGVSMNPDRLLSSFPSSVRATRRRRAATAKSESLARPALPRLFAPDARTSYSCPTKC